MYSWQGVGQGCSLSYMLYLTCDEVPVMIRQATDNLETGISVDGCIINIIRYADDKGSSG